jgi:D-sedoheptulose 7-phosphate isomerase
MRSDWTSYIQKTISNHITTQKRLATHCLEPIQHAAIQLISCLNNNGKILLCGNGGSAADAQHIAAEMVVRLNTEINRPAIPAMALSVDTSVLTACGNDYRFEIIFSRQIEALGDRKDTLIAISTSGNSVNIIEAVNMAHEKGLYVIGLLGGDGGKLKKLVDLPVIVPSKHTARIQESHILIAHLICDLVEKELFVK